MSILKKLSKKREDEPKTQPVSTRLTEQEYHLFSKLCEGTGYSISEAVRILIQQEISTYDDKRIPMNTESKRDEDDGKQDNTTSIQSNALAHTPVIKRSATVHRSVRFGRFTTIEWLIDDKLPCPLCNGWVSASNFSRHAKSHDMTTQDIFTKHKDKADAMVKERKDTHY